MKNVVISFRYRRRRFCFSSGANAAPLSGQPFGAAGQRRRKMCDWYATNFGRCYRHPRRTVVSSFSRDMTTATTMPRANATLNAADIMTAATTMARASASALGLAGVGVGRRRGSPLVTLLRENQRKAAEKSAAFQISDEPLIRRPRRPPFCSAQQAFLR